jgi:glucose-6-phosphate isomerase
MTSQTIFDFDLTELQNPTDIYIKKLSDLSSYYENITPELLNENPILYLVEKFDKNNSSGHLIVSTTTIYSGIVNNEFYFTSGHYHAKKFSEIYFCLNGEGLAVLKKENEEEVLNFSKGTILHIDYEWAHRIINVGKTPLKFMSIYTFDGGFNYQKIIDEGGFKTRVFKTTDGFNIERR